MACTAYVATYTVRITHTIQIIIIIIIIIIMQIKCYNC